VEAAGLHDRQADDRVTVKQLLALMPLEPVDQAVGIILDLRIVLHLDHDTLAALQVDNLDRRAEGAEVERAVELLVDGAADAVLDIALALEAAAVVEIDLQRVARSGVMAWS
jgi:hypothetical protein